MIGSFFDDTLIGDDGNNILEGNGGNDSLYGGAGDDFFCPPSSGDGESDTVDGGEGYDAVEFQDSLANITIETDETGSTTITNGNDTVIMTNVEELLLDDATLTFATGTAGDDDLSSGGNAAILFGLDGDDFLEGAGAGEVTTRSSAEKATTR